MGQLSPVFSYTKINIEYYNQLDNYILWLGQAKLIYSLLSMVLKQACGWEVIFCCSLLIFSFAPIRVTILTIKFDVSAKHTAHTCNIYHFLCTTEFVIL